MMDRKWLLILITGFSFLTLTNTYGSTIDTLIVFIDGEQTKVETLQKGTVSLYATSTEEAIVQEIHGNLYTTNTIQTERFFISNASRTEEITVSNYKRLIMKYLPNAPYLHKKLGKLGFRYENISQMVEFYNKFRADIPSDRMVNTE